MLSSPEQALGALLVLLALLDVFLTVLYARLGTSIVSRRLARGTWLLFRRLAEASGSRRGTVLSLCGPVVLVLLVLAWALALTLGTALIIHPVLGTAIARSNGQTPTDFLTAMYAGGSSMTIVGSSDFAPLTGGARLFYLFTSLVGMSVMSLTLTYLMQVYGALQRRNALGLKAELLSGGTGDAAELVARVGPEGQFQAGYTNLSSLAEDMVQAKEAHNFYPVLFYFRFREAYYSVSRFALVALDAASLIETALGDECRWLKRSASVEQLRRASLGRVTALEDTFLPGGAPEPHEAPGAEHV